MKYTAANTSTALAAARHLLQDIGIVPLLPLVEVRADQQVEDHHHEDLDDQHHQDDDDERGWVASLCAAWASSEVVIVIIWHCSVGEYRHGRS